MFKQHALLIVYWAVFSVTHSIFASERFKKTMLSTMRGSYKYYRVVYSLFALLTLGAVVVYHFELASILLWRVHGFEVIIAVAGIITGSMFMIFFAGKFFFELSGADIFLRSKKSEALIKTSFYKYVRHPLYTATLLFVWSIFFWHPLLSNLISCICITVYTIIGIRYEEKKLIRTFGESYIQYRAKTPMLVPKFYK